MFGEVAVTKLFNDVIVFRSLHDIVETHNVIAVDGLQYLDLIFKRGVKILIVIN